MNLRRGQYVGRLFYFRHKGDAWLNVFRAWLLPVMGSAGITAYLGWPAWVAVVFWVGFALAAEVAAVAIGWWEHRSGATEAHYGLAAQTDPYKSESLRLLRMQTALLKHIDASLAHLGHDDP